MAHVVVLPPCEVPQTLDFAPRSPTAPAPAKKASAGKRKGSKKGTKGGKAQGMPRTAAKAAPPAELVLGLTPKRPHRRSRGKEGAAEGSPCVAQAVRNSRSSESSTMSDMSGSTSDMSGSTSEGGSTLNSPVTPGLKLGMDLESSQEFEGEAHGQEVGSGGKCCQRDSNTGHGTEAALPPPPGEEEEAMEEWEETLMLKFAVAQSRVPFAWAKLEEKEGDACSKDGRRSKGKEGEKDKEKDEKKSLARREMNKKMLFPSLNQNSGRPIPPIPLASPSLKHTQHTHPKKGSGKEPGKRVSGVESLRSIKEKPGTPAFVLPWGNLGSPRASGPKETSVVQKPAKARPRSRGTLGSLQIDVGRTAASVHHSESILKNYTAVSDDEEGPTAVTPSRKEHEQRRRLKAQGRPQSTNKAAGSPKVSSRERRGKPEKGGGNVLDILQDVAAATGKPNFESNYSLGRRLGEGSFGVVRECISKRTGTLYACKIVDKSSLLLPRHLLCAKMEFVIQKAVGQHRNIVAVEDVYEDDQRLYILMEHCQGDLCELLLAREEPLSEAEAAAVFMQVLEGVRFCHDASVIHHDLKLENILVSSAGSLLPSSEQVAQHPGQSLPGPTCSGISVKLSDFGSAVLLPPGQKTTGRCGCSLMYQSPEVLRSEPHDFPADMWSLGVILYALLSSTFPFSAPSDALLAGMIRRGVFRMTGRHWDAVSPGAKSVVALLLQPDPLLRPSAAWLCQHPWVLQHCLAARGGAGQAECHMAQELRHDHLTDVSRL